MKNNNSATNNSYLIYLVTHSHFVDRIDKCNRDYASVLSNIDRVVVPHYGSESINLDVVYDDSSDVIQSIDREYREGIKNGYLKAKLIAVLPDYTDQAIPLDTDLTSIETPKPNLNRSVVYRCDDIPIAGSLFRDNSIENKTFLRCFVK